MKKNQRFNDKKILVMGLGISGFSVAKLLVKLGAFVTINGQDMLEDTDNRYIEMKRMGISYIGGGHDIAILHDIDLIVKNPGIPYQHEFIIEALKRKIPIITEPEVAASVCEGKIIALTGTNGKTTTTMLIYEMFQKAFSEVYVAGNIGVPFSDVVQQASADAYIILELSSFQLMGMPKFKPDVALILNIDEAHLDYHDDFNEYLQAKLNIFNNMDNQSMLVLNADDQRLRNAADEKLLQIKIQPQKLFFGLQQNVGITSYVKDGYVYGNNLKICSIKQIVAPGKHNLMNVLAAVSVAKYYKISNTTIVESLSEFSGVAHRLEYIGSIKGKHFYNDSKATNNKAAQVALAAFQQPIIWIAGGYDRGQGLDELRPFCEHVKKIITFGQTKEKFLSLAASMKLAAIAVDSVDEAVITAYENAEKNNVILFSPACASWDQYQNFEQRGENFKKAFNDLHEKNNFSEKE